MHGHDSAPHNLDPSNPEDAELIGFFVALLPERLSTLRQAMESSDFNAIKVLAHQLKGSAPNFGFAEIGLIAGDLERSISEGVSGSISSIRSELDALIALCESSMGGC